MHNVRYERNGIQLKNEPVYFFQVSAFFVRRLLSLYFTYGWMYILPNNIIYIIKHIIDVVYICAKAFDFCALWKVLQVQCVSRSYHNCLLYLFYPQFQIYIYESMNQTFKPAMLHTFIQTNLCDAWVDIPQLNQHTYIWIIYTIHFHICTQFRGDSM